MPIFFFLDCLRLDILISKRRMCSVNLLTPAFVVHIYPPDLRNAGKFDNISKIIFALCKRKRKPSTLKDTLLICTQLFFFVYASPCREMQVVELVVGVNVKGEFISIHSTRIPNKLHFTRNLQPAARKMLPFLVHFFISSNKIHHLVFQVPRDPVNVCAHTQWSLGQYRGNDGFKFLCFN